MEKFNTVELMEVGICTDGVIKYGKQERRNAFHTQKFGSLMTMQSLLNRILSTRRESFGSTIER